jgi:pilus assembly protein CpaF
MRDGSRRVTSITEVQGMEGDIIVMQDLFSFEHQGFEDGRVIGKLKPTGIRPKFMSRLEQANIFLSPTTFGVERSFLR